MAVEARSFLVSDSNPAFFNAAKGIRLKSLTFSGMRLARPTWWMGSFVCTHLDRFSQLTSMPRLRSAEKRLLLIVKTLHICLFGCDVLSHHRMSPPQPNACTQSSCVSSLMLWYLVLQVTSPSTQPLACQDAHVASHGRVVPVQTDTF